AVVIMSALFGLIHFMNPHRTWVSTINTALVGVPLSISYLKTRALWLPIGIHFIWNFLQGFVLGLPVSGLVVSRGILTARVTGPEYLTGGAYGPEGGIFATGVILMATVYLVFTKRFQTTAAMQRILSTPLPTAGHESSLTILTVESADEDRIGIS